jgi:hypothetical protein
VKLEDRQSTAATEVEARGPLGATASFASEDLDPGRERRPLESYFQEIGGTRTLRREEEVYLAKELEAATAALRGALYRIPCSSRHVVDRWDDLRALSHTGAKLSESMGDEETGEIAARVERAVKKLRVLHAERDKHLKRRATKAVLRSDEKIADELERAQLSLAVLAELRERVFAIAGVTRAVAVATIQGCGRAGLAGDASTGLRGVSRYGVETGVFPFDRPGARAKKVLANACGSVENAGLLGRPPNSRWLVTVVATKSDPKCRSPRIHVSGFPKAGAEIAVLPRRCSTARSFPAGRTPGRQWLLTAR